MSIPEIELLRELTGDEWRAFRWYVRTGSSETEGSEYEYCAYCGEVVVLGQFAHKPDCPWKRAVDWLADYDEMEARYARLTMKDAEREIAQMFETAINSPVWKRFEVTEEEE